MKARPIMRDGERHQCVDGFDLLWAIRDRFEGALKADDNAWTRYDRHCASWTEQRALDCSPAFWNPTSGTTRSAGRSGRRPTSSMACCSSTDSHHRRGQAGGFTEPARRAAPDRLERDLRKLIAEAHEQARRARDALASGTDLINEDGQEIKIDPARTQTVLPVVITLDELGVSPRIWVRSPAG